MRRFVVASLMLICSGAYADSLGLGAGSVAFTAPAGVTTINKYTTLSAAASQFGTSLTVADTSICTNGGIVLVWQSSGYTSPNPVVNIATLSLATADTFGHYEFVRLAGAGGCTVIAAPGTLTLSTALAAGYTANTTQVVSVPEYTTVDVPVGATLAPAAWNPGFGDGGILAFFATGAVTVEGTISANGLGYLGGISSGACTMQTQIQGDATSASNGDDITRVGLLSNLPGYQNLTNGGGGGLCLQSGGGGGGGAGAGGGGRLGNGACDGGQGGASISFGSGVVDASTMVFGGGGGGGAGSSAQSTNGAAGGGIVLIRALSLGDTGTAGTISANGTTATTATNTDGAGGGGAGGTISIRLSGALGLPCANVQAQGGGGGVNSGGGNGGGGGGGGGRLFVQSSSAACAVASVSGGAGGSAATAGTVGLVSSPTTSLFCNADAICATTYPGVRPVCDLTSNSCVECTPAKTGQCTAAKPVCSNNACAKGCTTDPLCLSDYPGDPYCETGAGDVADTGQCVQCNIVGGTPVIASSDKCPASAPKCVNDACAACAVGADCANRVDGRHQCSGGQCLQCITSGADANCGPSTPICTAGACGGSCTTNLDCSGRGDGNVWCDTTSGHCVPCNVTGGSPVGGPDECTATLPNCQADACAKCTIDAQCTNRVDGNHFCDAASGACVPCNVNGATSQCPDSAPVCTSHACGACTSSPECAGRASGNLICNGGQCVACTTSGFDPVCVLKNAAKPICAGNVCTACSSGSQCPTTAPICGAGACSPCASNALCASEYPSAPICDLSGGGKNGECVQCTANANCNAAAPVCTNDACTATCTTNAPCASYPSNLLCDTTQSDGLKGECVGCLSVSDCNAVRPTCPVGTRQCSTCTVEANCTSYLATPHCDTNGDSHAGQCVQCRVSNDCPATAPDCSAANACTGCKNSNDCTRFNTGFVALCNPGNGACVSCLSNSNCTSAAPVCNGSNSCIGCSKDSDCSLYPNAPACQLAGSNNPGQCHQCSRDNTSLCGGATPACNFADGQCQLCTVGSADLGASSVGCAGNPVGTACVGSGSAVSCGCAQDSDCGGPTSGRICDQMSHKCNDGCSRAPGRNDCAAGQFCTSNDQTGQTSGICTKTCAFNVDCSSMPALPFCLGGVLVDGGSSLPDGGSTSRCAGCRTDSDCSGNTPVCEPSEKICVQCTPANASGCSPAQMGALCLADETCGCDEDPDCGGPTSGRICNRFMHQCTTGCYLVGGNGCPSGMTCSASGALSGSCQTPNDMALASFDLSVPIDMSVPIDHAVNRSSVAGGGLTCAMSSRGDSSTSSLWLLAAVGLWLFARRRRHPRAQPSQD